MTLLLASVASAAEAELALAGGADIIDVKDPRSAFEPLSPAMVTEIVAAVSHRRPVSAAAGQVSGDAGEVFQTVTRLAEAGVDSIRIGFRPGDGWQETIQTLAPLSTRTHLIGVFFADLGGVEAGTLALLARHGFAAAMLDTAAKSAGRLTKHLDIAQIGRFIEACRAASLMSGLAGGLEAPDIVRLLPLLPDFLGFRRILCRDKKRDAGLDAGRIKIVRDLIPREATASDKGAEPKVDWRLLTARSHGLPADQAAQTDRVFVHDLVMPVAIGAYDFERGRTQRVRFNVDADVRRPSAQPEDMRDVFSYDLITDAIRLILSRGHVDLVETLAEEIATALLGQASVMGVKVRVEKLDVIDGCVGIEIHRERPKAAARSFPLNPGASA